MRQDVRCGKARPPSPRLDSDVQLMQIDLPAPAAGAAPRYRRQPELPALVLQFALCRRRLQRPDGVGRVGQNAAVNGEVQTAEPSARISVGIWVARRTAVALLGIGNDLIAVVSGACGAGIVAGSIAESELKEVDNKIAALRKAIELAEEL